MVWLYPVCRTNPDFLHNPAVVQQSTETVHRICEGNSSHWTAWDVTVMAREWAAGSLDNNGVILWATNEAVNGRDIRFAAREAANATIRPVLRVAYGAGIDPGADCSMFDDWSNVCPADTQPPTTSEPTPSPTPGPTPSTTAAPDETAEVLITPDSSSASGAEDEDNSSSSLTVVVVVVVVLMLCIVIAVVLVRQAKQKPSPEVLESRSQPAFDNPA